MARKPTIDEQRDAAINLEVGSQEDGASGGEFFKVGKGRLLLIYGNASYEMILPDDVDPTRSNPNIRPVHQKVLQYGFEDEYVSRILLTEKALISEQKLLGIDEERISILAFKCLQDVLSIRQMSCELQKLQEAAEGEFKSRQQTKSSTRLPSVPDIQARCEGFVQRARHVVGCINDIAVVFCGDDLRRKNWLQRLGELLAADVVDADAHKKHWQMLEAFIVSITETRNAIEHPKDGYRLNVADYSLGGDNVIAPPRLWLTHPVLKVGPFSVLDFMTSVMKSLVVAYEDILAALCDRKLRHQQGIPMYVTEVPFERRRNKYVRYGIAIELGGKTGLL